jgi:aminopeptidase N
LSKFRSNFDVKTYKIQLRINPKLKFISGVNEIHFKVLKSSKVIQLDLDTGMKIVGIISEKNPVIFKRTGRAIMLSFQNELTKNSDFSIKVSFEGFPKVAKNAPWDGGFVWSKDSLGKDWVGMACEGEGASMWLPCKDTWDDEPENLQMEIEVPQGLIAVSNGRLAGSQKLDDGYEKFRWIVSYPINHYNISINVGDYVHLSDVHTRPNIESLSLDYYVLKYNELKAKKHFEQSKYMLRCFEKFFGPYPFQNDGYKLVETPYWGMEHQSCVAYGNKYRYNEYGFDFIIVHESGHEWFANSITAADPADLWIHESFTTYSEALYVEYTQGKGRSLSYLQMQREKVVNKFPMQGPKHQNYHGWKDNDIYYKGSWVLQTLRYSVNNDSLWFLMLRELSAKFRHQLISTDDIVQFICKRLPSINTAVLNQYLNYSNLPVLSATIISSKGKQWLQYEWLADVKNFSLNLPIHSAAGTVFLKPGTGKKRIKVPKGFTIEDVKKLEAITLIKVGVM